MLSVVGIIAFVDAQAHRVESAFDERATAIGSHFIELEHGVNSVLEGFSVMLEVMNAKDAADKLMVARYASQMRAIFPQIHKLQMIERVPREQLAEFEKQQSAILKQPFRIRSFDFGHSRTWLPPEDKADYYVITLMEPVTPLRSQVLGMDIESSQAQLQALHECMRTGLTAVSAPYHIVNGQLGYMLIRAIDPGRTRFAKVVIRADTIGELPWLKGQKGVNIVIRHAGLVAEDSNSQLYRYVDAPAGPLESMFLPLFRWQKDLRTNGGDPFIVDISKQMRWQDIDLPIMAGILLIQFAVLLMLVKMSLEHYSHDRERLEHESRLAYLASHDSLTELPNRSLLMDRLEQAILRARRDSSHLALLFIDIDRFKSVNDTYGHDSGDRFLMTTSDTIRETIRAQDTLARLSGDEFVVLLERVDRRNEVERISRKIKDSIRTTICLGYRELGVGVSIGIAMYPDDGTDASSLLRHADTAMYSSKPGRPQTVIMI
jgi:diguanylate cyclase (GGDEF)-like protein